VLNGARRNDRPHNNEMQLTSGGWARASRAHFIKRRLQLISVFGRQTEAANTLVQTASTDLETTAGSYGGVISRRARGSSIPARHGTCI
jgi:shikimate 5-dehydrogenase